MVRLAIIIVASLWAWPAAAQAVVDGDTIKLKGVTWHLWGIDAPENKQSCGTYRAGAEATGTLAKLCATRPSPASTGAPIATGT